MRFACACCRFPELYLNNLFHENEKKDVTRARGINCPSLSIIVIEKCAGEDNSSFNSQIFKIFQRSVCIPCIVPWLTVKCAQVFLISSLPRVTWLNISSLPRVTSLMVPTQPTKRHCDVSAIVKGTQSLKKFAQLQFWFWQYYFARKMSETHTTTISVSKTRSSPIKFFSLSPTNTEELTAGTDEKTQRSPVSSSIFVGESEENSLGTNPTRAHFNPDLTTLKTIKNISSIQVQRLREGTASYHFKLHQELIIKHFKYFKVV